MAPRLLIKESTGHMAKRGEDLAQQLNVKGKESQSDSTSLQSISKI